MTARQDEPAGLWVGINQALQIGRKLWHTLNFIEHSPLHILPKKTTRIVLCIAARVWIFQGDIRLAGKDTFGQRGLAALARASQRDDRILTSQVLEHWRDIALNHGGMIALKPVI